MAYRMEQLKCFLATGERQVLVTSGTFGGDTRVADLVV
jgi:hypothetical protein